MKNVKAMHLVSQNYCFVFGTSPAHQVSIDTKMVKNLLDHIQLKQHKNYFVEIPHILN